MSQGHSDDSQGGGGDGRGGRGGWATLFDGLVVGAGAEVGVGLAAPPAGDGAAPLGVRVLLAAAGEIIAARALTGQEGPGQLGGEDVGGAGLQAGGAVLVVGATDPAWNWTRI